MSQTLPVDGIRWVENPSQFIKYFKETTVKIGMKDNLVPRAISKK